LCWFVSLKAAAAGGGGEKERMKIFIILSLDFKEG
jgi:hypothetical protein